MASKKNKPFPEDTNWDDVEDIINKDKSSKVVFQETIEKKDKFIDELEVKLMDLQNDMDALEDKLEHLKEIIRSLAEVL